MMIENECPMATQSFISVFPSHPPLLRLLLLFLIAYSHATLRVLMHWLGFWHLISIMAWHFDALA